jgi:hypothetical protein
MPTIKFTVYQAIRFPGKEKRASVIFLTANFLDVASAIQVVHSSPDSETKELIKTTLLTTDMVAGYTPFWLEAVSVTLLSTRDIVSFYLINSSGQQEKKEVEPICEFRLKDFARFATATESRCWYVTNKVVTIIFRQKATAFFQN